jgi:hypothetical protein
MTLICVGDGACGVEGNGTRSWEREWGKKKEQMRKNEKERVDDLCITQERQS